MKRLNVFFLILFGFLTVKGVAQTAAVKPLSVGDPVPELSVGTVINNNGDSILNLADNNKQIIILDFFDTYCSTCIEAMPKLDSLQKAMGDKIKIYLVTYQPKETMVNFFK
ncbi:thioredoxin domain-containing protein, partial [Parapedobacter defluvii]|uniref:TlpA family protein disulfide reductase n=1 Tax=Parapedobacter defluvii TaxID=2045106 RepID=UPI0033417237